MEGYAKGMEEPKEELRRLIIDPSKDTNTKLSLLYSIHHLGLTYLFLQEVDTQLDKKFNELNLQDYDKADLYTILVNFQVFRHHGSKLSCGMVPSISNSRCQPCTTSEIIVDETFP